MIIKIAIDVTYCGRILNKDSVNIQKYSRSGLRFRGIAMGGGGRVPLPNHRKKSSQLSGKREKMKEIFKEKLGSPYPCPCGQLRHWIHTKA